MDMRAQVWSPLQNSALWLGAWLFGHEPTDNLIGALIELGGTPLAYPEGSFTEVLRQVRQEMDPLLLEPGPEPVVRLILSGPGQPLGLPAGSRAYQAAAGNSAGALVLRTPDPLRFLVLVGHRHRAETQWATQWEIIEELGPLPAPAWLSPGEADHLLSQATRQAAKLIEDLDYVTIKASNPRLLVGSLEDFYDTPGMPGAVPARAAKLFARADRVAAIVETVTSRVGDHSLDPQLLGLWRHIREARMAGVSYAVSAFAQ